MPDTCTPTQQRMLAVLAAGKPVSREALHACLYDDQGPLRNIRCHLTALRKYLRPLGQALVYELCDGVATYRLVRRVKHGKRSKC